MHTAQEFTTQWFNPDIGEWQDLAGCQGFPMDFDGALAELRRMRLHYQDSSYRIINAQGVVVMRAGKTPIHGSFEDIPPDWTMPEDATCKDTNPKDAIGSSKPPLSTIPFPVLFEVGAAMLEGSMKYRRHNYRIAGVRSSVYFDATMRHLAAWWEGQDIDPDSGLHHVTKAIASLIVLRDAQMNDMIAQDDRPPSSIDGWLEDVQDDVNALIAGRPNPKPPYTIEDGCASFTNSYNRTLEEAHQQLDEPEFSLSVKLPCTGQHGVTYDMHNTPLEVELRDEEHAIAVAESLAQDTYRGREVTLWRRTMLNRPATPYKTFRFDEPMPEAEAPAQVYPHECAWPEGSFEATVFDEAPVIDPELVERLKKGIPALILAGIIMSALGCSPYQNGGLLGSGD